MEEGKRGKLIEGRVEERKYKVGANRKEKMNRGKKNQIKGEGCGKRER